MKLSDLNPAEFDAAIAYLERALADHSYAQQAFRRITKTKSEAQSPDIDLYANHELAQKIGRSLGIPLLDARPEDGFSWNGDAVAIQTETAVLLHEFAHWQIAPETRRRLPDFGLGAGPETGHIEIADAACCVDQQTQEREENLASLLGILWEVEIDGLAIIAFCEQNWLELADRPGTASHFVSIFEDLKMRELINQSGHPIQNHNHIA